MSIFKVDIIPEKLSPLARLALSQKRDAVSSDVSYVLEIGGDYSPRKDQIDSFIDEEVFWLVFPAIIEYFFQKIVYKNPKDRQNISVKYESGRCTITLDKLSCELLLYNDKVLFLQAEHHIDDGKLGDAMAAYIDKKIFTEHLIPLLEQSIFENEISGEEDKNTLVRKHLKKLFENHKFDFIDFDLAVGEDKTKKSVKIFNRYVDRLNKIMEEAQNK